MKTVYTDYNSVRPSGTDKVGVATFMFPESRYPNGEFIEIGDPIRVQDYEGFYCLGILTETMTSQDGQYQMGKAWIDYKTIVYPDE